MTDRELIQILRCDNGDCLRCGLTDVCYDLGDAQLADRLEALLAENERLAEIGKTISPSSPPVVPGRRGKWLKAIDNDCEMHQCDQCGARVVKGLYEYENPNRFCYHCGARMDGGGVNEQMRNL